MVASSLAMNGVNCVDPFFFGFQLGKPSENKTTEEGRDGAQA